MFNSDMFYHAVLINGAVHDGQRWLFVVTDSLHPEPRLFTFAELESKHLEVSSILVRKNVGAIHARIAIPSRSEAFRYRVCKILTRHAADLAGITYETYGVLRPGHQTRKAKKSSGRKLGGDVGGERTQGTVLPSVAPLQVTLKKSNYLLSLAVPEIQKQISGIEDSVVVRLLPSADKTSASSSSLSLLEALTLSDVTSAEKSAAEPYVAKMLTMSPDDALRVEPYLTDVEKRVFNAQVLTQLRRLRELSSAQGDTEVLADQKLREYSDLMRTAGRVHGQNSLLTRSGEAVDDIRHREMLELIALGYKTGVLSSGLSDTEMTTQAQKLADVYNRARYTTEKLLKRTWFDKTVSRAAALWNSARRTLKELLTGQGAWPVFHIPLTRTLDGKLILLDDPRTDAWLGQLSRVLAASNKPRLLLVTNEKMDLEEKDQLWTLVAEALRMRAKRFGVESGITPADLQTAVLDGRILQREDVSGENGVIRAKAIETFLKKQTSAPEMDVFTLWEDQWSLDDMRKGMIRILVFLTDKLVINATDSLQDSIDSIRYIRIQA